MTVPPTFHDGTTRQEDNLKNNNVKLNEDQIKRIQTRLRDLDLYEGEITGSYNAGTRTAIKEFQKNENLSVTGFIDSPTLNALRLEKYAE